MAIQEDVQVLKDWLASMLDGNTQALETFAAGPVDDVAVKLEDAAYDEVNPLEVLSEALAQSDLDPEAQEAVMAAASASAAAVAGGEGAAAAASASASASATADGGYTVEQLAAIFAEGIKVTIEDNDITNNIDNSLYVEGDVKGGIHQQNETSVVNADDGAVAAGGDQHGQFQTGDGQQVGDAHGVVNQGDNSGQQAGNDAWADNVTSGDNNTVASDGAVIGNENVQAHDITGSEFGKGDLTDDDSVNLDATITESFNDNSTDDDYVNAEAKVDLDFEKGGYGHEEKGYDEPEHGYEPMKEEEHRHEHDYDDAVEELEH